MKESIEYTYVYKKKSINLNLIEIYRKNFCIKSEASLLNVHITSFTLIIIAVTVIIIIIIVTCLRDENKILMDGCVNIDLEEQCVDWVLRHLGVTRQQPRALTLLGNRTPSITPEGYITEGL